MDENQAPTLEELRSWPAIVSLTQAATAFGISRSHAYELVRTGEFPAKVLRLGATIKVLTASIISALGGD